MLNISLNELLIVALLVLLLLKPKDYPIVFNKIKYLINQFLEIKDEIINGKQTFEKEIQEIEENLRLNKKILPEENNKND